jgi:FkbM family methyltransferase
VYSDLLIKRLINFCQSNIGAFDFQEAVITEIFRKVVKPADIVVDGGAHTGRHTQTLASLVGETGKVYAFEPVPSLADGLENKFKHYNNILIIPKALSNEIGQTSFNYVATNPSYSGVYVNDKLTNAEIIKINVETITLDSIIHHQNSCRLIKLDLEGAEYFALLGAELTLNDFSPMLLFENELQHTASKYGYSREQFFNIFYNYGYKIFDITGIEISDLQWSEYKPHFDNFIAAKKQEDIAFIKEQLPEILLSTLLEMNEVQASFSRSIFQVMEWCANDAKLVLFGAGNRASFILQKFPISFNYAVDNDPAKWGKKIKEIEVFSPQKLSESQDKPNIVIISLFADEIEKQLLDMGFYLGNILKLDVR